MRDTSRPRSDSSGDGPVDTGQVTATAAEVYDEFFLPALFAAWPPRLVSAAGLGPGMRVLDVACGTGVLAIEADRAVAPSGAVVGVDVNPGMLAVAHRKASGIEWREASAESLPFAPAEFDAVLSQFGLMFFRDREESLREMWRVLRPGGRLVVAVWDALASAPGYSRATALLARLFGDQTADLLRAPYVLGEPGVFDALLRDAAIAGARVTRMPGVASFPSIRSWMHTDVRGWTLADALDDDQFERLVAEAERELGGFVRDDGSVCFDHPALVATAHKT